MLLQAILRKAWAKNIQRNPPKKKVQNTGPTTTATQQRTLSNRTQLVAAYKRKQQAKNSSSRASFPKWVLILGSSRSGRHPKSAGFSWIAQLRFGHHFLEELGGCSSSNYNNNSSRRAVYRRPCNSAGVIISTALKFEVLESSCIVESIMGNCFSDVAGGQQAVGGVQSRNALDWQSDVFEAVENLGGTRGLSSQIQLSFSANKLRVMDTFSKSDPMLVGFLKRFDGSLEELGRTEVVLNSSSPNWVKELRVEYRFEEVQQLLLRVYDIDTNFANISSEKLELRDQEFLGEVVCALSEIVMAPNQKFMVPLHGQGERVHQHDWGSLTITAEEMVKSKSLVEIVVRCAELDNKDLFSKSDPFLRISRLQEDGSATSVYRTEVKKNNLNPTWKPIRINLQQLCNGDMDRPLKIECCNFNINGSHDLIGVTQISLNGLLELMRTRLPQDLNRPVQNQNKQPGVSKTGGKFYVESCVITPINSFIDYVTGGCELNFMVAVDFTASNGNPLQPDSLHYFDPSGRSNAYQTAIQAVGQIIHHYDTDKRFPCWGFGGRPIDGPVSHCFALNGNNSNPVVDGIPGIMFAYSQALRNITLAGPTLFAPVINMAASIASQHVSQDNQKYFVLLIITDGVITDLQQTITAIINAAELPLSLLIVGVGGADFTEMETLDADKKRLSGPDGRVAVRDIVQFMPMRNVAHGASIARSLLAELPGQLLEYMKSRGIIPGNRPLVQPRGFAS